MRCLFLIVLLALLAACTMPGTAAPTPSVSPTSASLHVAATSVTATRIVTTAKPTQTPTIPVPTNTAPAVVTATALHPDLTGYLGNFTNGVLFLEWTENAGNLSGTIQQALIRRDPTQLNITNVGFTGLFDGSRLTLTIPQGFGFATTISGTLTNGTLTLFWPNEQGVVTPTTFKPATLTDYNRSVSILQQQVAQERALLQTAVAASTQVAATAQAMATQQQAVQDTNAALDHALTQLQQDARQLPDTAKYADVLARYAATWATMQRDEATMHDRAAKQPLTCTQLGLVQSQLGIVEVDNGQMGVNNGQLQVQATHVQDLIKSVVHDQQIVRAAWATLQQAVSADTPHTPTAGFDQQQIDNAINQAQQQIDAATQATQKTQQQATKYDQQAADLLQQAKQFVAQLHCTE
jgi:hypothetical protein